MIKKFWYWLWGPPKPIPLPCQHDFERTEVVCTKKFIDSAGADTGAMDRYAHITQFCKKCGKLIQYKL